LTAIQQEVNSLKVSINLIDDFRHYFYKADHLLFLINTDISYLN